MRTQERDILKEYGSSRFMVTALGIENQSAIDKDMPIRVMGYDYVAYRKQIDTSKKRVPVITIVLNFGDEEWESPLALKDILDTPEIVEPYVQDYKIHVFNVAHLPKEVRNRFTSDFKIVADYFAERNNPNYQPGEEEIEHVEAVLELLRVFTCDKRYAKIESDVIEKKRKGGKVTMCVVLDRMENRGIEKGIVLGESRGIQKEIQQERQQGLQVLIHSCYLLKASKKVAREQVMQGYGMTKEEAEKAVEKYWEK